MNIESGMSASRPSSRPLKASLPTHLVFIAIVQILVGQKHYCYCCYYCYFYCYCYCYLNLNLMIMLIAEEEVRIWVKCLSSMSWSLSSFESNLINSQSLEDTQVGYISQKYSFDRYTCIEAFKYTFSSI